MSQEEYIEEDVVVEEEVVIDLDEINARYEDKGFFKRMGEMFKGLKKPHNTREYKLARVELQRLMAPLIAFVSVSLFVVVLIVMTAVSGQKKTVIEVNVAEVEEEEPELEEQIEEPPPDDIEPPPEDIEIQVDVPNPGPISQVTPQAAPPSQQVSVKPATQDTVAFVDSPVRMKSMTGSRTPGSIGAATRGGAGYGDAATEMTVMKVLWWLKHTQNSNGSWTGKGSTRSAVSDTALAVLAYLAHGEYPGSPSPYQKDFGPVVQRALEFLINSIQEKDGKVKMVGSDGHEYAFLIGTYALCEAYGMTKNPNCKDAALKTLARIIKGQGPTGGFDYNLKSDSTRDDLSFAGWALQALKAGKMAGLEPEGLDACIKKAINQLTKRAFKSGGFGYCAGGAPTGLTATGCLALQLLGYGNKPEVASALEFMREWQPAFEAELLNPNRKPGSNPQYYAYYATQCKYQAGMKENPSKADQETWHKWNAAMKKLYTTGITDLSDKTPDWSGKEHKMGYFKNKDHYSNTVMDSCLAALQLMVYYRYLPTTQTKAGKASDAPAEEEKASEAAVDKESDIAVDVEI